MQSGAIVSKIRISASWKKAVSHILKFREIQGHADQTGLLLSHQPLMPQLTRMSADNSRSSVLYKCVKCGQRYQGIASQVESQKCICGGELKAVRKILKTKGSA
jgi:hypothetical protein